MTPTASSPTTVVQEATGKVVLLGEHSVVYGQPAIAAAIDRKLRVVLRRRVDEAEPVFRETNGDARLAAALAEAAREFGLDPDALELRIESDIPAGSGLGSSAALSVALIRTAAALAGSPAPSGRELATRAARVENVFHGTSSGVDVAAVASGGTIWFERGGPRSHPVRVRASVDVIIALSGESRSTEGPVRRLRERVRAEPDLYAQLFSAAGAIVRRGADALARGDWQALGASFDAAHDLLDAFGVSTPTLDRMIAVARAAGALGAKLSGAGGGGAIIALAPTRPERVAGALESEGFGAFVTRLAEQQGPRLVERRGTAAAPAFVAR